MAETTRLQYQFDTADGAQHFKENLTKYMKKKSMISFSDSKKPNRVEVSFETRNNDAQIVSDLAILASGEGYIVV